MSGTKSELLGNKYMVCRLTSLNLDWCKKTSQSADVDKLDTQIFNGYLYVYATTTDVFAYQRLYMIKLTFEGAVEWALQLSEGTSVFGIGLHHLGSLLYGVYYAESDKNLGIFSMSEDANVGPKGIKKTKLYLTVEVENEELEEIADYKHIQDTES